MNDGVDAVKNAELGCCKLCPFSIASQLLFCFDFFFLPLWVLPGPRMSSVLEGRPGERLPSREMTHSFSHSYLAEGTPALSRTVTPHPQLPAGPASPRLTQFLAWLPQLAGTLARGQKGLGMRREERKTAQHNYRVLSPVPRFLRKGGSRIAYHPAPGKTEVSPFHF